MQEPRDPGKIPLRLSLDETMILLVGVRLLAEMVEAIEINGQAQEILINQLIAKLGHILPEDLHAMSSEIVEDILEANDEDDLDPASNGEDAGEFAAPIYASESTLPLLEEAIATQRAVDVEYYSLDKETISQQRINPYALRRLGSLHWLVAYCHQRRTNRLFRVDRIKTLMLTGESFERPASLEVEDIVGEDD